MSQETLTTPEFSFRYDKHLFEIVEDNDKGGNIDEMSKFNDFVLMQKMMTLQIDIIMPNLNSVEDDQDHNDEYSLNAQQARKKIMNQEKDKNVKQILSVKTRIDQIEREIDVFAALM